jgi:hypothetical protein
MATEKRCVFCEQVLQLAPSDHGDVCRGCRYVLLESRVLWRLKKAEDLLSKLDTLLRELADECDLEAQVADDGGSRGRERVCAFCFKDVGASEHYSGHRCLRCRIIAMGRDVDGTRHQVFSQSLRGVAGDYRGVSDEEVYAMAYSLEPMKGLWLSGR